jgi:hypothetical protein
VGGEQFGFDLRDLAAAVLDSFCDSGPRFFDLLEGAAIAFERCLFTTQQMPALTDHVDVLGIKLQTVADAFRQPRSRERGAAAKEWIINELAAREMI